MSLVSITCVLPLFLLAYASAYETACYPDIGCFTNAPPWGNTDQRSISTMPDPPNEVDTRFYLDTRRQYDLEVYYNDMAAVAASTLDPSKPTRLIIHGYIDGGDSKWVKDMSDTFLAGEDQNVIRVMWSGASLNINYDESAVNAEVAGATTGVLVNNMINSLGIAPSQFHCVGHSLGAHICGYLGNKVLGLGRISGLDPAGTYFEGTDAVVRLDETDALFVDVIHTEAGTKRGYGISQQSGDVDFWPNGGAEQPGCDQNILIGIAGTVIPGNFVECNHMAAVYLFTESILTACPFKSYPCSSYSEFQQGQCIACDSTGCPQQGYHADAYKNNVQKTQTYLDTNDGSPYCEYMTYIDIAIGSNSKKIDGYLYVTLVGTKGQTEQQQLGGSGQEYTLQADVSVKSLVYYDSDPGDITNVIIEWKQKEIELGKQYITVQNIAVWKGATQTQYNFCGDLSIEMKEKEGYSLSTAC